MKEKLLKKLQKAELKSVADSLGVQLKRKNTPKDKLIEKLSEFSYSKIVKALENQVIESIQVGWGEESTYFSTELNVLPRYAVTRIVEDWEVIIKESKTQKVYKGYRNDDLVFKIEAGSGITVTYKKK